MGRGKKPSMQTIGMYVFVGIVVLAGAAYVGLRAWAANAPRPSNLGVEADGQLAPCPGTPNCVTTQMGLESQRMSPLPFTGTVDEAQARLRALITSLPRTTIVSERPGYFHVEFRTALIGYTDDVQFVFDAPTQVIHFRSASRLGMGDMGMNRARMTEIASLWAAPTP